MDRSTKRAYSKGIPFMITLKKTIVKVNYFVPLILAALFILTSCDKYPDGGSISLRSKAERVANNWRVSEALEDGKNVTSDYDQYELDLTKGGSATLSARYSFLGVHFDYSTSGTWTFLSDKEKISFNYDKDDADAIYRILKLEEDEMWLREEGGSLELHFVTR
jgi:hypothetical protein